MADKNLALDGPCNGQYITPDVAEHYGYELCDWTWEGSEKVYMQPVRDNERRAGDGDEFARRFPYADERSN